MVSYLVKAGGWRNDRKVHEYLVFTHNHSSPAFNLKSKLVEFDHIEINIEERRKFGTKYKILQSNTSANCGS